jgi:hypothetical protein
MRATYNGDAPVLFSHYLDVSDPDKVTTLSAEPGKTYEFKQAEGYQVVEDGQFTDMPLPLPPDGDWSETDAPTWAEVEAQKVKEQAADEAPAADPPPPPAAPPARARKKEQADG